MARAIDTTVRQWCLACQRVTLTWTDSYGRQRCAKCDPDETEAGR